MKLYSLLLLPGALAWTRVDHWTTEVITTTSKKLYTSSIPVWPTGSPAPTPISSNVSTTVISTDAAGAFLLSKHTYTITVTDLFFAASDSGGLCVERGAKYKGCTPKPTFHSANKPTTETATRYWHPMTIKNPETCTITSYEYTTRQSVAPYRLYDVVPGAENQATESSHALTVSTWISTASTNLGGQEVTTTIVDVYLKDGAVGGVGPGYELSAMSQCVDPRAFSCSVITSATPTAACLVTGQAYPPSAEEANVEDKGGSAGSGPQQTGVPEGGSGSGDPNRNGAAGIGSVEVVVMAVVNLAAIGMVL